MKKSLCNFYLSDKHHDLKVFMGFIYATFVNKLK